MSFGELPVRTPETEAREAVNQFVNKRADSNLSKRPLYVRKKRTAVAQAMQWTGDNYTELVGWMGASNIRRHDPPEDFPELEIFNWLNAPAGMWIPVSKGTWVMRGAKGEFYPCADEVFTETYEVVA